MSSISPGLWALLVAAAFVVGFSKTGLPGSGILAVPMLAAVFGGRHSVGTALVLLISADIYAVYTYVHDAQWDHLKRLLPTVLVGFLVGSITLFWLGQQGLKTDPLNPIIGAIVLLMLALGQMKGKAREKLCPTSGVGRFLTGSLAGFTTMISNAAGPIMQIYMVATELPKEKMIATTAVFFLCVNVAKIPFYIYLGLVDRPVATLATMTTAACVVPILLIGCVVGKRFLPLVPQEQFRKVVLVLAGVSAVILIVK